MVSDFRQVILSRREGSGNSATELKALADGAATGTIPDYQLSAWLMAAFLNPLDLDETAELTLAMAETGLRLDLSSLPEPHLDKHSTGGVGDKTTLVLLPLLASLEVTMVKMSGAGLGITGGTIDKLSSIPGFRTVLSPSELISQASKIGLALSGQTSDLAPADKKLYELRDTTATTDSNPLITSSILSKKIAGGSKFVTIDVKCGSGAFMTDLVGASQLASMLEQVGGRCGLAVKAEISDMSQPLGSTVGNALEVEEALAVLAGDRLNSPSQRFRELCVRLASEALVFCGRFSSEDESMEQVERALTSGKALEKAVEWIAAQGGPHSLDSVLKSLPKAPHQKELLAPQSGWVKQLDARAFGEGLIALGGGRKIKSDDIDPAVGFALDVFVGMPVTAGERLGTLYATDQTTGESVYSELMSKIEISSEQVEPSPLFLSHRL